MHSETSVPHSQVRATWVQGPVTPLLPHFYLEFISVTDLEPCLRTKTELQFHHGAPVINLCLVIEEQSHTQS